MFPPPTTTLSFCRKIFVTNCLFASEWQSHRVTGLQTLKGTQYTGGQNFFVPDFNKLPYSLRLQGDDQIKKIYSRVKTAKSLPAANKQSLKIAILKRFTANKIFSNRMCSNLVNFHYPYSPSPATSLLRNIFDCFMQSLNQFLFTHSSNQHPEIVETILVVSRFRFLRVGSHRKPHLN